MKVEFALQVVSSEQLSFGHMAEICQTYAAARGLGACQMLTHAEAE